MWKLAAPPKPADLSALAESERTRAARYRRQIDAWRFVGATVLLRAVVANVVGLPARRITIDRTCNQCGKDHGPPELPGTGLHASISHGGAVVGVAITAIAPVGLDVEATERDGLEKLGPAILAQTERAGDNDDFYRYWTRKEAIVKATKDGIGVGLQNVRVSAPGQPAALVSYASRPTLTAVVRDLVPPENRAHVAALAVLTDGEVNVVETSESLWFDRSAIGRDAVGAQECGD